MRNKRVKETNRHIKKYNRIKIFGNIIYWACLIATFSYWLYIIFLRILYNEETASQFPFTNILVNVIFIILPFVSLMEYLYENLLHHRAMKILLHRQERIEFRKLHN